MSSSYSVFLERKSTLSLKLVSISGDHIIFNVFARKLHVVTQTASISGDLLIFRVFGEKLHVVTQTGVNIG